MKLLKKRERKKGKGDERKGNKRKGIRKERKEEEDEGRKKWEKKGKARKGNERKGKEKKNIFLESLPGVYAPPSIQSLLILSLFSYTKMKAIIPNVWCFNGQQYVFHFQVTRH